jgi:hypothetical protein
LNCWSAIQEARKFRMLHQSCLNIDILSRVAIKAWLACEYRLMLYKLNLTFIKVCILSCEW